jgi:alpha-tubulin suppressor-like RCC1 family protein
VTYDFLAAPAGPFDTVDLGYNHGCAVRSDGSVACWGNDMSGQLDAP